METIRIKEATVVMATKEDGKLTSDVNKNVEDMDTSNGGLWWFLVVFGGLW